MFRSLLQPARAALLALAVLLVGAERSEAQFFVGRPFGGSPLLWGGGWGGPVNPYFGGWGGYSPYGWGGWGGSYFNYGYSYSSSYYMPPTFVRVIRSYPMEVQAPIPPGPATVEVTLPASAELWFDEKQSKQTGNVRYFKTPVLNPGRTYTYDLRASWRDGSGAMVTREFKVDVWAGQKSLVQLTQRD